ncbi:hypothetical protein DM01DRAFT_1076345 [Hesseltinella vesiculosa]|uniref:Uncharacterized protein n=1 Tax=Hesseltinella vesiculosa TaxID=101127 RepID=A0A1X2GWC9_9FUNG|nr:hypothetical protein DM01DRAFT_1076345 [Hesseltinella vesiculosa]
MNEPRPCLGETITLLFDNMRPADQEHPSGLSQWAWERDLELDLDFLPLPLDVSASLVMTVHSQPAVIDYTLLDLSSDTPSNLATFFVMETYLDELHFARPVPTLYKNQIMQNGLQALAMQITKPRHSAQDFQMSIDKSCIKLRLVTMLDKVESYRSILAKLLGEGMPREVINNIVHDAENAYLTLATNPDDPVVVCLSQARL